MKILSVLLFAGIAGLSLAFSLPQDTVEEVVEESADEQAARATIEDYVLAFYQAEPDRLERCLSPNLKKMGYWWNDEESAWHGPLHMSFEQAKALASKWNAEGQEGKDIDYSIELFEVNDKTASAKLTAKWGLDYFQLVKEADGEWRIHHVLWQSAPR